MTDFPQTSVRRLFVTSGTPPYGVIADLQNQIAVQATGTFTWPSANLILYCPFYIPWPYPVRRVFWANGSTAASNMAFGIYSINGTKIYATGATAQSGASSLQYVTPSPDFILPPGRYYMALVCDGTTSAGYGLTYTAIDLRLAGMLQEAGSTTLPATMTPAQYAQTMFPLCGITFTASGF